MSILDDFARKIISDDAFDTIFNTIVDGVVNQIEESAVTGIKPQVFIMSMDKGGDKRSGLSCVNGIPDDKDYAIQTFHAMGKSYVEQTSSAPYAVVMMAEAFLTATSHIDGSSETVECIVFSGMTLDRRQKIAAVQINHDVMGRLAVVDVETDLEKDTEIVANASEEWLTALFMGALEAMSSIIAPNMSHDDVVRAAEAIADALAKAEKEDKQEEVNQRVEDMLFKTGQVKFSNN